MSSQSAVRLCVPVSDAAIEAADALEPLAAAVSYKGYRAERRFAAAVAFMDTPLNIIDVELAAGLERMGLWRLMDERPVASVACDLGPAALELDEIASANGYPRYRLLGSPLSEEEYIARARRNVDDLRTRFPGALRLENLNYFPTPDGAYERVCEPAFIGRVVEAVDAELLLDVGHALISSANLGISAEEYFGALPLNRVRELHVSASGVVNGGWEDTHDTPGPREWCLVRWLCERAPIRYVTIEYYRRADLLVRSYRELAAELGLAVPARSQHA